LHLNDRINCEKHGSRLLASSRGTLLKPSECDLKVRKKRNNGYMYKIPTWETRHVSKIWIQLQNFIWKSVSRFRSTTNLQRANHELLLME
jgi:hypothetical protein